MSKDSSLRPRGLFINSKNSTCSIHEVGLMCYSILRESNQYDLDYTEDPNGNDLGRSVYSYDFVIVNYHFVTNNQVSETIIRSFGARSYAIVTEITFGKDPTERTPQYYGKYIVLDPTVEETKSILAFPRPIDVMMGDEPDNAPVIPVIGSFGFATDGKRWDLIAAAVNTEFDEAIIRFNIPVATYVPNHEERIDAIRQSCLARITKPGIRLEISHANLSREEIVKWCAGNTINCFFYFREHMYTSGLAAVTDQAVASKRPLLVTPDCTFRHVHKYVADNVFPNIGIKLAIQSTQSAVLRMSEDWHKKEFVKKFETSLFV